MSDSIRDYCDLCDEPITTENPGSNEQKSVHYKCLQKLVSKFAIHVDEHKPVSPARFMVCRDPSNYDGAHAPKKFFTYEQAKHVARKMTRTYGVSFMVIKVMMTYRLTQGR